MPDWPAFAGFTGVVLAILLVLARISQAALGEASLQGDAGDDYDHYDDYDGRDDTVTTPTAEGDDRHPDGSADAVPTSGSAEPAVGPLPEDRSRPRSLGTETDGDPTVGVDGWAERADPDGSPATDPAGEGIGPPVGEELTTGVLLANVAVSQGILGSLLIAGAWYTGVPAAAFGAGPAAMGLGAAAVGVGLGLALYAANEAGAAAGRRVGFGGGTELREALAPETAAGWAVLLFVVLPIIAGFEELLFRGALIGAMHAGFGVSPWILAGGSSVAFAAGHGAQGRIGMTVTGVLGFVLAAAFVLTGSLLTAVVAHYLVNALEFLVHEWAGIDPAAGFGDG